MIDGKARCIAIANGTYVTHAVLEQAVPDAEEMARILRRHDYETTVLPSLERGDLLDEIDKQLGKDVLIDGALIVVWIGHGTVGADHTLRLLGCSKGGDVEMASAGELGEWAVRTGAKQVLVVIDTCFSGSGIVDATRLGEAVNSGRTSPEKTWFGVIAASLQDEPARSGALVRELIRLLDEGPRNADFRWDKTRPYIRGDDLLQAVLEDWGEPRQQPRKISGGKAWDLVRNPRFEAGVPDQPIEHLLMAGRGGGGEESYFTGREFALGEIVKWIGANVPGLFVLTGPPGCGKSAVAGRIVSLSSSAERKRLLARTEVSPDLDPGESSVDAQIHARGLTLDSASEEIARRLGLDSQVGQFGVLAEAQRRRKAGDPILLVVDGLDEAGTFSRSIAAELLAQLAREALVLVATRDVASGDTTLISQLGPAAQILDLGKDIERTRQDIRGYVKRRLADGAATMNSDLVADELAAGASSETPQFLLARLVTSQLRERPVDTSSDGWRLALATTVESALERDLQSVVLTIGGQPHPTAAREMLRALALAYGGGFPADDIWPAVASVVSPTGTVYTRDHSYAVLTALGRHIIAGFEGDQPVYRIAHQRLVDYMSGDVPGSKPEIPLAQTAVAVGAAILEEYERLLDAGFSARAHVYLWRHAWRHLAEAGPTGLDGLRSLVERDRTAFLPDLAAALELIASKASAAGRPDRALEPIDEAIAVRRELGDDLKLAMALFSRAFIQAAKGDSSGADDSTTEAVKAARKADDRPESRKVLSAVLLARADTQLLEGQYRAALLPATEAIVLLEAAGTSEDENWSELAAAYSVIGRAYFALEDFGTAGEMSQRAIDLVDKHDVAGEKSDLRNAVLAILATVQLSKVALSRRDTTGEKSRNSVPAAGRILREYRQKGRQRTIGDLPVARGILCYVRAGLLGHVEVSAGDTPRSLLNEAIALARPFADRVLEAAFVFADAMSLLIQFPDDTDPARTAADCAEAERGLRPFADANDFAAALLGQLLDTEISVQFQQVLQGRGSVLPAMITRQKEAVALLRKCGAWFVRYQLAQALSRLGNLLGYSGVTASDQAIAARAEAIEAWRPLVGKFADAPITLAALLCDQAGQLLETRAVEAADLAREAVTLSRSQPMPQFAGLAGLAETNLAAAQLTLGGAPEVRDLLVQAFEHLEPLVPHPIFSGILANACMNLAQVEFEDRNFPASLLLAQRAVDLFDAPDLLPNLVTNRPLAILILGRAQRGNGQVELGTATLHAVIESLCGGARDNKRGAHVLAHALNTAAPDFWDEVLAGFADRPDLSRLLNLLRFRTVGEIPITVHALVTALESPGPIGHRGVRGIARQQRIRAPKEFDAVWQETTGTLPGWLQLNPAQESVVIAWWNTPSWKLSRDYLKSHPALLDPDTDIVLEEFGLDGMDTEVVTQHLGFLNNARTLGADAAYASVIAAAEAWEWVQSKDLEQHLADHVELLRPEITVALREEVGATRGDGNAPFVAILDLARRGESQLAFQAVREPDAVLEHLQASWRSDDFTRLASLATIVQGFAETESVKRTATVALAIARVLGRVAEEPEQLIAAALEGSSEADRKELLAIVGDAIGHHSTSATELAGLAQAIGEFAKGV